MRFLLALAVTGLFFSTTPQGKGSTDEIGWSAPVNGLHARLSLARGQVFNSTPLIVTYLELRNTANVANVLEVPFNENAIRFEVVDEQGKLLPPTSLPYDGLLVEVGTLRLPHDSYLRFDISHRGAGIPKAQAALLDLGYSQAWVFSPNDKHSYYLRGRLSIDPAKSPTWSGIIEIPQVKIPTGE
jgi:hypothetical protein